MGRQDPPDDRLRRASCLIGWFEDGSLVIENYLTGQLTVLHPQLLAVLGELDTPVTAHEALRLMGGPANHAVIDQLLSQGVLLSSGSALEERDRRLSQEWPWRLDARYFHFSTRRTRFAFEPERERTDLVTRAQSQVQPPAFKDYGRTDRILPPALPPPAADLGGILYRRRTGRSFSPAPISIEQLSTILQCTWGISELRSDPPVGVVALKTSPSGGARHPIEVYCVAQNVSGLDPGVYHYCSGRHVLARIPTDIDLRSGVLAALTGQAWVVDAAAVFLMTGLTTRSAWKYPQSHAYRVLLLDAGHLGQTFHLICTALDLSPWTSAALDEEAVDALLSLDDPAEVPVYAAACGWASEPISGAPST